jgi:hypothetical protein
MSLHCSLITSSPLPKSTDAGEKLTLWATLVAVTVVLPPLELMAMLLEKLPAVPEENRTTTSCGCPGKRLKLAPETMLNGAETVTVPVSVPPPEFQMVKAACVCWVMNVWGRVRLGEIPLRERLSIGVVLKHR